MKLWRVVHTAPCPLCSARPGPGSARPRWPAAGTWEGCPEGHQRPAAGQRREQGRATFSWPAGPPSLDSLRQWRVLPAAALAPVPSILRAPRGAHQRCEHRQARCFPSCHVSAKGPGPQGGNQLLPRGLRLRFSKPPLRAPGSSRSRSLPSVPWSGAVLPPMVIIAVQPHVPVFAF